MNKKYRIKSRKIKNNWVVKEERKISEGLIDRKKKERIESAIANKKKTNRQIIVHKTQHRKLKTYQHEPHQKLEVISGALEG